MVLELFHPIIQSWFEHKFKQPTEPQRLAWPAISRHENTLIAAPTGSGKTLSAFLVCIDRLVREAVEGNLENKCKILYLSPLKALASDIRKNLEIPLAEIQEKFTQKGYKLSEIRSQVRTGDTPPSERQKINKKPPHILVTTPESLYLMLTTPNGREVLKTVETIIVDEIHALARDKRGSHMSLSLERLKAITLKEPTMIGLSATQKPVEEIASFLVGVDRAQKNCVPRPCQIFDVGHSRNLDLGLLVPPSPLTTLATHEQWTEIYQNLSEQIKNHRSTLVFVNTRRLAERVAFRLTEMLGEGQVLCHHGSLSKERRLKAEEMLKAGQLKAIVATASLELGIDIGYIDLVCQIGVPFSIATFLQRIGRSGHAIQATPKGRLIPLSRDELIESLALIHSVKEKYLDRIEIPTLALDILTQQLIAECAGRGVENWMSVDEAFALFSGAWPYRNLDRETLMKVIQMASNGYAPGRRKFAYLIWDRFQNRISVKAGAKISAITSGGAIPEMGEYRVVLEEDGTMVGTVNEDFAIESLSGDIFVLGTHSWKVRHVRGGEVVVQDAHGQPPSIPFWLGESPGRTKEFSIALSQLREHLSSFENEEAAIAWLKQVTQISDPWPLLQAVQYIWTQKSALGIVPTREKIVFERFFDDVGGMHLVIHSPYGARINRGWGLAVRKRFCRTFDFELQSSADDDGVVLSLGTEQGFPIEQLFKMLDAQNVRHFLVQALLVSPMFGARWRWNTTRALAVLRQNLGKRVPPALQRFRAEDLLTAVFPAQTQCQENAAGDKEIPDHPLVQQTVKDCLTEAMDIEGLENLFEEIEKGNVKLIAKDTREPSPFAYQLINAFPYAFLDDAPAEDRRTRAVSMRPTLSIEELQELDRMNPEVLAQVSSQAFPSPATASELYEVLVATPAFPFSHISSFQSLTEELLKEQRATIATIKNLKFLVAAEAIPMIKAAYENIKWSKEIALPESLSTLPSRSEALQNILKGWLEIRGPIPTEELQTLFGLENPGPYLEAIEATGAILRCKLNKNSPDYTHWSPRGLLRRIHRLTVEGLRKQIRPVSPEDYLEFIFEEHGLNLNHEDLPFRGSEGLQQVISKLEGYEAPASAWERELFSGRVGSYEGFLLDQLTSSGVVAFGRITPKKNFISGSKNQKLTSVVPLTFTLRKNWSWVATKPLDSQEKNRRLSSDASLVLEALQNGGAQFIDEIQGRARLLESQVERALGELAAEGLVTSDHFHSFRNILSRSRKGSGRWSLLKRGEWDPNRQEEKTEKWAHLLLSRYGIVFRDLLERETLAPSWGELVRVYRRLEARGEIRGGRFITGVSGEQFGLPETHEKLLQVREQRNKGLRNQSYTVISSSDPLNLLGIITKTEKISSSPSTRILFQNGKLSAIYKKQETKILKPVSEEKLLALRLIGTFRGRLRKPSLLASSVSYLKPSKQEQVVFSGNVT